MSHRYDCPDEWEARAAGRRDAQEYGYSRSYRFEECEDAQSAYRRGFYAEQERQREEAWMEEQRRQAEEEAFYASLEVERQAEMEAAYAAEMEAQQRAEEALRTTEQHAQPTPQQEER